jgi:transcriptional regulator with XRE-family HTH domain
VEKFTADRIRKIRKALGISQKEFGRILWAASTTVEQWESGECAPVGMHHRLLRLWEQGLANPSLSSTLKSPEANDDPRYLLYRLLQPLYEIHSAENPQGPI